jgi:hypothetical protein
MIALRSEDREVMYKDQCHEDIDETDESGPARGEADDDEQRANAVGQGGERWNASRNAGLVLSVSALALIVLKPILPSFAHHGIRPQRIRASSRSSESRLSRTTGWKICGATLDEGGISSKTFV